ncbi:putative transcriptional regulator [Williamsia muralis]|nr:putative transcriptional regulator [Williamsia marianensis]
MNAVWNGAPEALSVHDILAVLTDRQLAYTTVSTVMTNLYGKGFLTRKKFGRAYRYCATYSREEVTAQILRGILHSSDDPTAVLVHFAQTASSEETEALRDGLPGKRLRQ